MTNSEIIEWLMMGCLVALIIIIVAAVLYILINPDSDYMVKVYEEECYFNKTWSEWQSPENATFRINTTYEMIVSDEIEYVRELIGEELICQ